MTFVETSSFSVPRSSSYNDFKSQSSDSVQFPYLRYQIISKRPRPHLFIGEAISKRAVISPVYSKPEVFCTRMDTRPTLSHFFRASNSVPELHKIDRLMDFKALKLWISRSGKINDARPVSLTRHFATWEPQIPPIDKFYGVRNR